LVVESQFTVGDIGDQGKYTLYFSPIKDAPGHSFAWQLGAADQSIPTGLALCQGGNGAASLSVYGVDWAQVYGDEIFIAERQAPLPRAYVVYGSEVYSDSTQAITRLLDERFDLRNMAVTSQDIGLPTIAGSPADPATVSEYQPARIVLEGSAASKGLLILGDAYHPGWQATVNSQPAPIIKVNQVERGLLVPPGPYRVLLYFAPETLRSGEFAGGAGLILFVILGFVDFRRGRQRAAGKG
jgi:hypothetical protein